MNGMNDMEPAEINGICPNCGEVTLNEDLFEGASYGKDGSTCMMFSCPKCSSTISVTKQIGTDAAIVLTRMTIRAIEGFDPIDDTVSESGVKRQAGSHIKPEEDVTAKPSDGLGSEGKGSGADSEAKETESDDGIKENARLDGNDDSSDGKDPAKKPQPDQHGVLNINYMPLNMNKMMTFGVELRHKPPRESEYVPSEEDIAKLEYFRKQLEDIDFVDDAIDEIDSGYNFNDGDNDDDSDDSDSDR